MRKVQNKCPVYEKRITHKLGDTSKKWGSVGKVVVLLCVIIITMCTFTACGEEDHDDGKCDICGKTATYSGSREEYCDKHLEDAINWYIEQGQE